MGYIVWWEKNFQKCEHTEPRAKASTFIPLPRAIRASQQPDSAFPPSDWQLPFLMGDAEYLPRA